MLDLMLDVLITCVGGERHALLHEMGWQWIMSNLPPLALVIRISARSPKLTVGLQ